MPKFVYDFAEGNKDLKDLLGGKGANLAEMTRMGLPVPPGFVITTEACLAYLEHQRLPDGLMAEVRRHVTALERHIDAWNRRLPPLRAFIRPGGSPAAACLHLARTVCRRAERQVVLLAAQEPVAGSIVPYLNRLADALFVAARYATQLGGREDIPTSRRQDQRSRRS